MSAEPLHEQASLIARHWWFRGRRRILRKLVDQLVPPSARIVDVGCGLGANIASLGDRHTCVGIDPSTDAISLARRRFPGIRFLQGTAAEYREELSGARLVLLMDVLEHVADDAALFEDVAAASVPGSRVLVTVPADPSMWSEHDEALGHHRRYTVDRLTRLWQDAPYEARLITHFNSRLYWIVKAVRYLKGRLGRPGAPPRADHWTPIEPLNSLLERIFAGEAAALLRALSDRATAYRRGVSLLAVLERTG